MEKAPQSTSNQSNSAHDNSRGSEARRLKAAEPSPGGLARLAASIHDSSQVAAQRQMKSDMHGGPTVQAQMKMAELVNPGTATPAFTQAVDAQPAQLEASPAASPNRTGLPDNLKAGVENLSGVSLDNVQVHYNSARPAQLNALAYAQGTDIHVAPGQEKHLPHEAWHVVQQAQGRVKPTMQMKSGVPVNDDRGLEHEADVMGARALQMTGEPADRELAATSTAGGQEIAQRIAFYHGTTIEAAGKILSGIDPSKGGGEFGQGFYTVFSLAQAKHIAMYYWDKEEKYNEGNSGVAAAKISVPDDWWAELMKTGNESYSVVHKDDDGWFNTDPDPAEGRNANEALDTGEDELDERDDKLWWMPRNQEELEYQGKDDRDDDLGKDIIIGPIKDKQTPYLQVVFGNESASYLLNDEETVKSEVWKQTQSGAFGSSGYKAEKNQGMDDLGSLKKTDAFKAREFKATAATFTTKNARLKFVQDLLGGMNESDICDEVDSVLQELNIPGDDKAGRIYNYYDKGVPTK